MDAKQTAILNRLQEDGFIDSWTIEPELTWQADANGAMSQARWDAYMRETDSVHPRDVPGR